MKQWKKNLAILSDKNSINVVFINFADYADVSELYQNLSASERAKADQLRFDKVHRTFVITRGVLRQLLAQQLGCMPATLDIHYQEKGKPYLADHSYQFNVSHTDNAAVIALSPNVAMGIDIENSTREADYMALAEQVFTRVERQYVLNSDDIAQAFFRCWTRKEAFIKAHGAGMFSDLKTITTTNSDTAEYLTVRDEQAQEWFICDLPVIDNYIMSLACSHKNAAINLII